MFAHVSDFAELDAAIVEHLAGAPEAGRAFYLSIPPSAYVHVAQNINAHCRPKTPGAWLRVAIEKPFGSDLASAVDMVRDLESHLAESELFRVDHYLGKRGVKQIPVFRQALREVFEPLLHRSYVTRVDVALREPDSVA